MGLNKKAKIAYGEFVPNKCILEFMSLMVNTINHCCQFIKDNILFKDKILFKAASRSKRSGAGRGGVGELRGLQRIEYVYEWYKMKGESEG